MKEKVISLQLVKDELHRVGGVLKFLSTAQVIVKSAHAKYFADMDQQRFAGEKARSSAATSKSSKQPKKVMEKNLMKLKQTLKNQKVISI